MLFHRVGLAGLIAAILVPSSSWSQDPPALPSVSSPGGKLVLSFHLTAAGAPVYALTYAGRPVVRESRLGLALKDRRGLTDGFAIEKVETSEKDETWDPVWGEVRHIRNHYKEAAFTLQPVRRRRSPRRAPLPASSTTASASATRSPSRRG